MNENELQVTLRDIQEIMVSMDGRLLEIEKQQTDAKYLSEGLSEINGKLEHLMKDEALAGMKASISKLASASSNLVTAINEQQIMQDKLIKEFPQRIKTEIVHRFTDRQRPYIIGGIVMLLVAICSLFTTVQLWRNNKVLRSSDLKIRTVKLLYPKIFLDVDTMYHENPKKLEAWVEREETRLSAIIRAEEAARLSKNQADRATEKLNRLKEEKRKNSK